MSRISITLFILCAYINSAIVLAATNVPVAPPIFHVPKGFMRAYGTSSASAVVADWNTRFVTATGGKSSITYSGGGYKSAFDMLALSQKPDYLPQNISFILSNIPIPNADKDSAEVIDGIPKVLHVPIFSNALAIVYKLPAGILPLNTRIKMSASLLAGMYQGTITNWNHSDIVAINPFLANVDIPIEAVGRGDACGVSYSFTEFLTRGAPSSGWNVISDRPAWESPVKSTAGNQGMADFVSRTPGAIGYVTYGLALSSGFDFVDLLNKDGHYVAPSHDSVNAAVEKYLEEAGNPPPGDAHWGEESLVFLGGEETYPLSMFLYFITLQSQVIPKYNGAAMGAFLQYLQSEHAQSRAITFGYFPIPQEVIQRNIETTNSIQYVHGVSPLLYWSANAPEGQDLPEASEFSPLGDWFGSPPPHRTPSENSSVTTFDILICLLLVGLFLGIWIQDQRVNGWLFCPNRDGSCTKIDQPTNEVEMQQHP